MKTPCSNCPLHRSKLHFLSPSINPITFSIVITTHPQSLPVGSQSSGRSLSQWGWPTYCKGDRIKETERDLKCSLGRAREKGGIPFGYTVSPLETSSSPFWFYPLRTAERFTRTFARFLNGRSHFRLSSTVTFRYTTMENRYCSLHYPSIRARPDAIHRIYRALERNKTQPFFSSLR